jgi:hypothetical protein
LPAIAKKQNEYREIEQNWVVDLHSVPPIDFKIDMGENISNVDIRTTEYWVFVSSWFWRVLAIDASITLDMDYNGRGIVFISRQTKQRAKRTMDPFNYYNGDVDTPVYPI